MIVTGVDFWVGFNIGVYATIFVYFVGRIWGNLRRKRLLNGRRAQITSSKNRL